MGIVEITLVIPKETSGNKSTNEGRMYLLKLSNIFTLLLSVLHLAREKFVTATK